MGVVFWSLFVGIYAAVASVLLVKYRRTRDAGLLWLFFLLILWPIWTHDLHPVHRSLLIGEEVHPALYQNMLVTAILALIAVAMLHRKKS